MKPPIPPPALASDRAFIPQPRPGIIEATAPAAIPIPVPITEPCDGPVEPIADGPAPLGGTSVADVIAKAKKALTGSKGGKAGKGGKGGKGSSSQGSGNASADSGKDPLLAGKGRPTAGEEKTEEKKVSPVTSSPSDGNSQENMVQIQELIKFHFIKF